MNINSTEAALQQRVARLAQEFSQHMEREETALTHSLEVLRHVHARLLGNDLKGLTVELERQAQAIRNSSELDKHRSRLRQDLAHALNVPLQEATITALAARLPGASGERLTWRRDRLRRMAREADQVNRNNAALIRYSLDFFSRLLVHLTGGPGIIERYGRSGSPRAGVCGSFFQARG